MSQKLREGLAAWRRHGPVRGARLAFLLGLRTARRPLRRRRVLMRPLGAKPADVRAGLGTDDILSVFRGRVLRALPTVQRFEKGLDQLPTDARGSLLAAADRVLAHEFDLLGSGPTQLGEQIDWLRDFKSGRTWPTDHISQIVISYPDKSDIKVPWELSRFQHLPLLAAAHRLTGDSRYLDEIGHQLDDWLEANPVEVGPNWACTMDVAIRASNWVATLAMCAEAAADLDWFRRAVASLLLHGRFIRSHPEWAETRGNHYLSDVVGLLPVAAVFCAGREGRGWAAWATAELEAEMQHQVRRDGCDHEASIPYHRLVAELFICGSQAADELEPGTLSAAFSERLERMLQFASDYTRPDGLAPQIGDADDGRFLPLTDYGSADPRSHLHLFDQSARPRPEPRTRADYPQGGYWIMRDADVYVIVRCGDVGVGGLGSHSHNDQLSFELMAGGEPLIVDPGSYLYTADPAARNLFRSTGFHSTLRIDGAEQNPLSDDALFQMRDTTRAEAVEWQADGERPQFVGRHHGYERLVSPAVHTRTLALEAGERTLRILDSVASDGPHRLEWTFPLAGRRAAASVEIDAEGVEFELVDGWISPGYGRRERAPFLRGRKRSAPGDDVTELLVRFG